MTFNTEMDDESRWIWLTSEQMGFPLRWNLRERITVKPEVRNNAMTSVLIKPHFFLAPIITDFIRNTKRELYDEKLEDALEMLNLE